MIDQDLDPYRDSEPPVTPPRMPEPRLDGPEIQYRIKHEKSQNKDA